MGQHQLTGVSESLCGLSVEFHIHTRPWQAVRLVLTEEGWEGMGQVEQDFVGCEEDLGG